MTPHIAIIGGGAGGCFCAIETGRTMPKARVTIFEKSQTLLAKVRVSGGGRCNVTHAQFDPTLLASHYPRGGPFLLPLFYRFQPRDTMEWFEKEGVPLIIEEDGRCFPKQNSSEAIISCFFRLLEEREVEIIRGARIDGLEEKNGKIFVKGPVCCGPFDAVVMATGAFPKTLEWLEALGLNIVPQVPSLFTFNCPKSPFSDLAGISLEMAEVTLPDILEKRACGPLLITHWGFSGPAVLKLSSFCARELAAKKYSTPVRIDWAPTIPFQTLMERAFSVRKREKQLIKNHPLLSNFPKALFQRLLEVSHIDPECPWATISNKAIQQLVETIKRTELPIEGKTTYKNEFVTAGGVALPQICPKTMASKKQPWLFFTGEVLDIDGITGGFNFQAAWTTAWVAARGIPLFLVD